MEPIDRAAFIGLGSNSTFLAVGSPLLNSSGRDRLRGEVFDGVMGPAVDESLIDEARE